MSCDIRLRGLSEDEKILWNAAEFAARDLLPFFGLPGVTAGVITSVVLKALENDYCSPPDSPFLGLSGQEWEIEAKRIGMEALHYAAQNGLPAFIPGGVGLQKGLQSAFRILDYSGLPPDKTYRALQFIWGVAEQKQHYEDTEGVCKKKRTISCVGSSGERGYLPPND